MSSRRIIQKKQKKRISKTGLPPGTNLYTGSINSEISEIDVYSYSAEHCDFYRPDAETLVNMELSAKLWINVNGISSPETIKLICDKFKVHYLYQEDIMNVFQRPKIEEEDSYIFVTFKSLEWNDKLKEIDEEQISAIISKNVLITFQEKPGDGYDILRDRLKVEHSVIREKNTDYFFYRLIDITVDTYFDILEKMGDYLEDIENEVLNQPDNEVLLQIQNNKKEIMQLRKNVYPMRDMLNKLILSEHDLIEDKTKKYFKDVLDHTIQIMDTVETYRDINVSLKDVYLNAMSHEMNRIMKILTIISTFFIPLTFIVGVYGMNFKYMPELEWQIGYYLVWLIMLIIVIGLTIWFKRKGWF
jgi:magnesium transporter